MSAFTVKATVDLRSRALCEPPDDDRWFDRMTASRIAILTHSTNPRGGVAQCLALGEALCALGHAAAGPRSTSLASHAKV